MEIDKVKEIIVKCQQVENLSKSFIRDAIYLCENFGVIDDLVQADLIYKLSSVHQSLPILIEFLQKKSGLGPLSKSKMVMISDGRKVEMIHGYSGEKKYD